MKTLHTRLLGAFLAALTALGLTANASTEDDPAVFGFTNKSCSSLKYIWFKIYKALVA